MNNAKRGGGPGRAGSHAFGAAEASPRIATLTLPPHLVQRHGERSRQ
jgi:hypothetical protein